mgnify:FL=1
MLDNQMLLLVVLGLAIYYLTRPNKVAASAEPVEETVEETVEEFAEESNEEPEVELEVDASEIVEEGSAGEFVGHENAGSHASLDEAGASLHGDSNPNAIPSRASSETHDSKDFLPSDKQDGWFEDAGEMELDDAALISVKAGHHIGVNTVGQSLRNATYDLRGTIANPKTVVSPWMNSTIEPDTNIKYWC